MADYHPTIAQAAEEWLYAEGATRYMSRAFGEFVATTADVRHLSLPAAKREFDYSAKGRTLLAKYGAMPTGIARS